MSGAASNQKSEVLFLNGRFLPLAQAYISPMDRGFLYGDGIFETIRVYSGKVFRLTDHLKRLACSAKALKLPLPCSSDELRRVIRELLKRNHLTDAVVRIALSRGVGGRGPSLRANFQPTLLITASPFHGYPSEYYEKGIRVIFASIRLDVASPLPRHKTANYLLYILARAEAEESGAVEALLLNSRGEVAEAATANIFIVRQGRVITPPLRANILPGITRKVVLDICAQRGIPHAQRTIDPNELLAADEVFITNSLMEIMPVVKVGTKKIGSGRPGPLTRNLRQMYQALTARLS